ncbi:MAG: hypothetical protein WCF36_19635 [Candidatus Nanopelagicales bacterium]
MPSAEPEARPANEPTSHWADRLEFITVVVLSVTTILTAWSAFESSKWGGAMSISFSQASSARIEASRLDGVATTRSSTQVQLWTSWLAESPADPEVADFLESRFPEPLATAHADWLATNPLQNPSAPASPFEMPSYVMPEKLSAAEADARADAKFTEALTNNQRGDNYTLMTVLFAAVLFFAAMSNRMRKRRSRVTLLGFALGLGLVGLVLLATFPKLI